MSHIVEEKQHARLSPSAAKRWMTCPGSVRAIEALNIEDKPSKYAAEGTVAHEIHELCLLKGKSAIEYVGKTITADGFKFKVTKEMAEAVQESLDFIADRFDQAEQADLEIELQVEVRSSLEYLGIPGLDGGTSDVVMLLKDGDDIVAVEILDYKHGAGVAVEPTENPQAMCYALGICAKYQIAEDVPVYVTISQPRAHHPDGRIRTWETTAGELITWQEQELVPAAKRTQEEDAEFVPSDEGCRFCNMAGQCPALYNRTQEVAMLDFDECEDDVKMPDIATLTADQKRFIMDHADTIRSFLVSVENQVKHEVDSGSQEYEGHYKLVRSTTHRKLKEDALDFVMSPLFDHLDEDDIYERKPVSLTEIEKRLKKVVGNKDAKAIMDEITYKPEGKLVIAKQSDKRKSVEPSVINDFTDL